MLLLSLFLFSFCNQSDITCTFTCSSFNASYYGKILRHITVRCSENLGINKRDESVKGVSTSIRDHTNETGHITSFNNFHIIDKASNDFHLLSRKSFQVITGGFSKITSLLRHMLCLHEPRLVPTQ